MTHRGRPVLFTWKKPFAPIGVFLILRTWWVMRDLWRPNLKGLTASCVSGSRLFLPVSIRDKWVRSSFEREKAIIGLFVTLTEPTKDMLKEASSAGFHEVGTKQYPKIQILTIKGLLEGRERPEYFDQHIVKGSGGFKKAKKEASSLKLSKLPFRSVDGESIAAEEE